MLEINNETNICFDISILERIAESLTPKNIELILTDNEGIKELNIAFRSKDSTTDVLSFPFDDMGIIDGKLPLGSVVINLQMAKTISEELKHSLESEVALLFIHGGLHLLGYDHEKDNGEHRAKEQQLMELFNLPKSLIDRNQ
ncbi:rRNA maturation RNase YbeY [Helicobacter cappadocius]|uniref:Endoribonuclease YbeY n=1 Tax=Helicobacter cappadocius TaxID=3063998 RepID=A0AA90PIE4_9HELI|nr:MULTISPECIES: rRNA maturation RNase YbeY [unclassified Helicobacter]MDO7252529.1 rRNA maturation RNase YbeY [Helicobacter sp. faydin-H75]MDP2538396.1 rRNA maturation RNase YbeY [Helicobacter sp. faydin-H76]